jgi:hypothetical protein
MFISFIFLFLQAVPDSPELKIFDQPLQPLGRVRRMGFNAIDK